MTKLMFWSIVGALGILAVWGLSGVLLFRWYPDPAAHGTFGDMFGAVNALFSGWAFLGVIVAIILQRQELELQREELRASREAQEESARAQGEQLKVAHFHAKLESLNYMIRGCDRRLIRKSNDSPEERKHRKALKDKRKYYERLLERLLRTHAGDFSPTPSDKVLSRSSTRGPMRYLYIHDEANEAVYRLPSEPQIGKDRHGDITATLTIEITRADNYLVPPANRWAFPTSTNPQDKYSAADRGKIIGFFMTTNTPPGKAISEGEYEKLRETYEQQARANKPST